jgi:hypothetical protein
MSMMFTMFSSGLAVGEALGVSCGFPVVLTSVTDGVIFAACCASLQNGSSILPLLYA